MTRDAPIRCLGCGRAYAAARFAFGRTLSCACGRRVGAEPASGAAAEPAGAPRFAVDAMLGGLARWLRVLGFDATWSADVADADLVRQALDEGRWILTRDRALPEEWRVPRFHLVRAEGTLDQLREVVGAFALADAVQPFARCTRCNTAIEPLARDVAARLVPPRVLERNDRFWRCPTCERIYWEGTHVERMRRTLAELLASASPR